MCQKGISLSPAIMDLLSPAAVKDFIISSYQGFIFLSKTANQLTCAYITFILIKHIYCIIHFMQHNFVFQLTFYPFRIRLTATAKQCTIKIQFRYAPDTDAILLLIQIQSPDTAQIRSRRGYHSDTHSCDLQLSKHSWMASTSPSPTRFYHLSKWNL